ncbi:terpenoid synthase [Mycena sp. CBHHK59/15]|nr:terpenoid synthase [Mycena sp. CBHHK59/15]
MSFYDDILARLYTPSPWSSTHESAVLEPFTYVTSNPGKEILDRLIEGFNIWMNIPMDEKPVISKVVNMLHNTNNSQLRRGRPVAHSLYGIPQTINAANYISFWPIKNCLPSKALDMCRSEEMTETAAELLNLHRGQGLELLWRDSFQCPTEEEYIGMVNKKTGGLLRIGIKLMMACFTTNVDTDYVPLMDLLGYSSNKGFAEDLSEGKFSFPVMHGVRADTSNCQILNVLQKRPTAPTLKTHAIAYLKTHTKPFEYTLSVLDSLERQTRAEVSRLEGNAGLDSIREDHRCAPC